jgi:hypothetical protein
MLNDEESKVVYFILPKLCHDEEDKKGEAA